MQGCEKEVCLIPELIFGQSHNVESKIFSGPEQLKNSNPEAECS